MNYRYILNHVRVILRCGIYLVRNHIVSPAPVNVNEKVNGFIVPVYLSLLLQMIDRKEIGARRRPIR